MILAVDIYCRRRVNNGDDIGDAVADLIFSAPPCADRHGRGVDPAVCGVMNKLLRY